MHEIVSDFNRSDCPNSSEVERGTGLWLPIGIVTAAIIGRAVIACLRAAGSLMLAVRPVHSVAAGLAVAAKRLRDLESGEAMQALQAAVSTLCD
ncbi:MAG: hypothetical protein ACR65U_03275 [Methylocystis sp.]